MSEEHQHTLRYTIVFCPTFWGTRRLILTGTGSSLKDGELLIFGKHESFTSINYATVLYMRAEAIHE